jgi:hypothetical protein
MKDSQVEIHIHHYVWTSLMIPLTAFSSPLSAIGQSWLLAVHLDGITRWGMDDTWTKRY